MNEYKRLCREMATLLRVVRPELTTAYLGDRRRNARIDRVLSEYRDLEDA